MDSLPQPRVEYTSGELDVNDIAVDPYVTVRDWLDDAITAGTKDPTAVTVATVDAHGFPDARVVLLRGVDTRGATFFTNRQSAKGQQIAHRNVAALTWVNTTLERQIRMRGTISSLPDGESDDYFASRPRGAQIAAHASNQSEPVASRDALAAQFDAAARRFAGDAPIPRPAYWGGYLLVPDRIEFWQGRRSRMHDRILLTRDDGVWLRQRIQP